MNAALSGLCGAVGGSLRTIGNLYYLTTLWQDRRQEQLAAGQTPDSSKRAVDPVSHVLVGAFVTVGCGRP